MKSMTLLLPVLTTIITGCALPPEDDAASSPASLEPASSEQASELSGSAIRGLPDTCFAELFDPLGSHLVRLDLATETITVTPDSFDNDFGLSSLGLVQNHLVACSFPNADAVDILDLATGIHTQVPMPCDSATALGDKIYVHDLFGGSLTEFADLRALIANTPLRTLAALFASRLGAGDHRLLAAWHSDDEAIALDLETGVSKAIPLPGYDGWIFGLFENPRVRLLAGGWVETGIYVYDTASGQLIRRLFEGTFLQGLACSSLP